MSAPESGRTDHCIDYYARGHPLSRIRSHFAGRARRRMLDRFIRVMAPTERTTVLDLGVSPDRALPESNFFEAAYPFKHRIVAASIEDAAFLEETYPGLRFERIARGPLPFADEQFDVVFCSAVLEHVGDRAAQRAFVAECVRVARRFFLTTPNRGFPVEFHTFLPFLHWLPQSVHQALLRSLGMGFWASTENLNLLTAGSLRALFPPCRELTVRRNRLFGLTSNLIAYGGK